MKHGQSQPKVQRRKSDAKARKPLKNNKREQNKNKSSSAEAVLHLL